MTAFVALLTLDFRRTERASVDCLPCLTIERSDSEISQIGNHYLGNSWGLFYLDLLFGSSKGSLPEKIRNKEHQVASCIFGELDILQCDEYFLVFIVQLCRILALVFLFACRHSLTLCLGCLAYSPWCYMLPRWKPVRNAKQRPRSRWAFHTGVFTSDAIGIWHWITLLSRVVRQDY